MRRRNAVRSYLYLHNRASEVASRFSAVDLVTFFSEGARVALLPRDWPLLRLVWHCSHYSCSVAEKLLLLTAKADEAVVVDDRKR